MVERGERSFRTARHWQPAATMSRIAFTTALNLWAGRSRDEKPINGDGYTFDTDAFFAAHPHFDEAEYLAANEDVAAEVRTGAISSGAEHYERFGILENRALNPRARPQPLKFPFAPGTHPSRRDKILANLELAAVDGVEIGAFISPLVRPEEGKILFVDYADTKTLQDKYRSDASIDVEKMVHVGAVWGAQTLQECIGLERKID